MNCLVLNPIKQLDLSKHKIKLISLIAELNIINKPIVSDNENYYFSGEHYLKYISFIGCSPYLNFEPRNKITITDLENSIPDLNYIQFSFNQNNYTFKKTDFGVKAICPKCKSKIIKWHKIISDWEQTLLTKTNCPQCNQVISIFDIDWKKTAGFFQTAILFHGIQADLAAPTDELLLQLKDISQIEWKYFNG